MRIIILAGQYYDEETGLHYNYHRYYDPKTGRYLTPDPIGLGGGINLFVYASNNPINAIDPFGLMEDAIRAPKGFFGRQLDSVNTRIHQFNNPEVWGPGQGEKNFMLLVDAATIALSFGAEKIGRTCLLNFASKSTFSRIPLTESIVESGRRASTITDVVSVGKNRLAQMAKKADITDWTKVVKSKPAREAGFYKQTVKLYDRGGRHVGTMHQVVNPTTGKVLHRDFIDIIVDGVKYTR